MKCVLSTWLYKHYGLTAHFFLPLNYVGNQINILNFHKLSLSLQGQRQLMKVQYVNQYQAATVSWHWNSDHPPHHPWSSQPYASQPTSSSSNKQRNTAKVFLSLYTSPLSFFFILLLMLNSHARHTHCSCAVSLRLLQTFASL